MSVHLDLKVQIVGVLWDGNLFHSTGAGTCRRQNICTPDIHSKFPLKYNPYVVTDSDDMVIVLEVLVAGYKTVDQCHLDSYTVTVCYCVSSHCP